ncbi:hypothetical protein LDENG_00026180 [Lucifuga dentata]|nr:hypothetical protein LDENG_00026180 [Lucifuga dentata]
MPGPTKASFQPPACLTCAGSVLCFVPRDPLATRGRCERARGFITFLLLKIHLPQGEMPSWRKESQVKHLPPHIPSSFFSFLVNQYNSPPTHPHHRGGLQSLALAHRKKPGLCQQPFSSEAEGAEVAEKERHVIISGGLSETQRDLCSVPADSNRPPAPRRCPKNRASQRDVGLQRSAGYVFV